MKKLLSKINSLRHWQIIAVLLAAFDAFSVNFAFIFALWLRYDFRFTKIQAKYLEAWKSFTLPYMLVCVAVFYLFRLYKSVWRFASYREFVAGIEANLICFAVQIAGTRLFVCRMPISYYIIGISTQMALTLGVRFSYRFINLLRTLRDRNDLQHRVLLVGAGSAGQMILRDVMNGGADSENRIVGIIDDNPNKWGRYIDGVKILGGRESIFEAVEKHKADRIFIAIPSASADDRREILNICKETGCELKMLPGISQLIDDRNVNVGTLESVSVEDLLGREPIKINMREVYDFLSGKTVLVTGGGGSIGSEICRQVASHSPKRLIIFDIYENNAYDIQLELKDNYPNLDLVTLIGSVRDVARIEQVFEKYRPDVVYHAAAHKHVPLMEDSPCESIKNNVIGTYNTANAAMKFGCEKFVLISSDKAVNPTNIMGASKRICEMVIQYFAHRLETGNIPESWHPAKGASLAAVRFGNVLGSNGSVVPLFKKQIAKGGPVTVTHPDIIRYFMTVPEAVSLVLQAGVYAKSGEIFVLQMGEPVKIDTLARNLIKLAGLKPDEDIKIVYTGLRPGEKLYEERLMAAEGLTSTANELISIGRPLVFDYDNFPASLAHLEDLARANNEDCIREAVMAVVETYHLELGGKPPVAGNG